MNDTLILISSDHGGNFGGRLHGLARDDNLLIPWVAVGPGIKRNYQIQYTVGNVDISATAVTSLGYSLNPWWKGVAPQEIFE